MKRSMKYSNRRENLLDFDVYLAESVDTKHWVLHPNLGHVKWWIDYTRYGDVYDWTIIADVDWWKTIRGINQVRGRAGSLEQARQDAKAAAKRFTLEFKAERTRRHAIDP